ncbi:MAG: acetylxylan esterase [Clostridia bacterium]|nr:acetylxylan esterase [Clostridia bacterium]
MDMNFTLPEIYSGDGPVSLADWEARRQEILDILRENVYGFSPKAPDKVSAEVVYEELTLADKAIMRKVNLSFDTPGGVFTFPVVLTIPRHVEKPAVFLLLNFSPEIPDKYYPQEEVMDAGYACACVYYKDITSDSGDMTSGLAGMYQAESRADNGWGKISMWSFALSRVMDYLETLDEIDKSKVIVIGHSRLGKTALWTAAQDTRFAMVCSNNAGCSGDALSRMNARFAEAENIHIIYERFPFWFCKNYSKYIDNEDALPCDQHFLVGAVAPRPVAVGSAVEDLWAYPASELECCRAASEIYERLGVCGLIYPKDAPLPEPYANFDDGNIAYHIRAGAHFLSRADWNAYIHFANKKFK